MFTLLGHFLKVVDLFVSKNGLNIILNTQNPNTIFRKQIIRQNTPQMQPYIRLFENVGEQMEMSKIQLYILLFL